MPNAKSILFGLPYSLRRWTYASLRPSEHKRLEERKKIVTSSGYSLLPFLQTNTLFVHIPKAAGISICRSLYNNLAGGHLTLAQYAQAFSKKEYESMFKFTFVRNPWSRFYSAYSFLKNGGVNSQDRKFATENQDILSDFNAFTNWFAKNQKTVNQIHFKQQLDFITLPNKPYTIAVDYVGKFENIARDFQTLCETIGVNSKLTHNNKTKNKTVDYRAVYTPESIKIIEALYEKDINLLGYSFTDV